MFNFFNSLLRYFYIAWHTSYSNMCVPSTLLISSMTLMRRYRISEDQISVRYPWMDVIAVHCITKVLISSLFFTFSFCHHFAITFFTLLAKWWQSDGIDEHDSLQSEKVNWWARGLFIDWKGASNPIVLHFDFLWKSRDTDKNPKTPLYIVIQCHWISRKWNYIFRSLVVLTFS